MARPDERVLDAFTWGHTDPASPIEWTGANLSQVDATRRWR
jgi:hypothetical protein